MRRNSEHGVKLLANLLPFVKPGELLDGESNQQVFRTYWPMASANSFSATPVPASGEAALGRRRRRRRCERRAQRRGVIRRAAARCR